jgi:hypothetical protein
VKKIDLMELSAEWHPLEPKVEGTDASPYKSRACVALKPMSSGSVPPLIGFNVCSCQEPRSSLMGAFSFGLLIAIECGEDNDRRTNQRSRPGGRFCNTAQDGGEASTIESTRLASHVRLRKASSCKGLRHQRSGMAESCPPKGKYI